MHFFRESSRRRGGSSSLRPRSRARRRPRRRRPWARVPVPSPAPSEPVSLGPSARASAPGPPRAARRNRHGSGRLHHRLDHGGGSGHRSSAGGTLQDPLAVVVDYFLSRGIPVPEEGEGLVEERDERPNVLIALDLVLDLEAEALIVLEVDRDSDGQVPLRHDTHQSHIAAMPLINASVTSPIPGTTINSTDRRISTCPCSGRSPAGR